MDGLSSRKDKWGRGTFSNLHGMPILPRTVGCGGCACIGGGHGRRIVADRA
jgi:hypothetical protein